MLKLSKKVEYGLIAVKHIASQNAGDVLTAKEISKRYDIPYELLSKILQRLAKEKIISSYQGVKGGYTLVMKPNELKISSLIEAIDGPQHITECMTKGDGLCSQFSTCNIKNPLAKVQSNINNVFDKLTLSEII
jgi:Rrf2 family transcriptional regulator, cysteine metabolism repressor